MTSYAAAELFDLTGRTAVITGGSRGLGREMAIAFATAGADVVIASRKLEACEAAAAEIAQTTGRRALPLACHVGHWDQVEQLANRAYEEFGSVEILVNNAGMSPLYPSLYDVTEELYDKVMAVNLKGAFRLSAVVGKRMVDEGGGSIINVSSTAAERPTHTEAVYAAAKAGLEAITMAFAHEYGPSVRVNCIAPGPFLTDIADAWDPRSLERVEAALAMHRSGRPSEIVGAALYLASDASSFTTGSVIAVDGGPPQAML